jgi:glycosyltransferase involved in cell wall biosynthesis
MDVAVVAEDRTRVASPMKLLEYMAMGRPVVAPALDNIRDLITDGVNGLLFVPSDAQALAAVLRSLREDGGLRSRLGDSARRTVCQSRNWSAVAKSLIGLMAGPAPAAARLVS